MTLCPQCCPDVTKPSYAVTSVALVASCPAGTEAVGPAFGFFNWQLCVAYAALDTASPISQRFVSNVKLALGKTLAAIKCPAGYSKLNKNINRGARKGTNALAACIQYAEVGASAFKVLTRFEVSSVACKEVDAVLREVTTSKTMLPGLGGTGAPLHLCIA